MGIQMMMVKVLQFLGEIVRYDKNNNDVTKAYDAALEAWKKDPKTVTHPDELEAFKDWFWYDTDSKIKYGQAPEWVVKIVAPIIEILNSLLVPVIILLGTAGTIYAIVLGVQYSKAETADKRDEAKKRLIHAVIGIVIMLVVLILLKVFVANAFKIFNWVQTEGTTTA